MNHTTAFELLSLYSLDALEDREARAVARHVSRCRVCRGELDDYAIVASALAGELDPRPSVWQGILNRIDGGSGRLTPLEG